MELWMLILGGLSYLMIVISLITSIYYNNKLKSGIIYNYLIWVNTAFIFIVTPYTIWFFSEYFITDESFKMITDSLIYILMATAASFFMYSSIKIRSFVKSVFKSKKR